MSGSATIDHRRGDHRDGGGHDGDSNNHVDHRGHASGGAGGRDAGVVGFVGVPCYSAIGLGRAMIGADHTVEAPVHTPTRIRRPAAADSTIRSRRVPPLDNLR